MANPLDHITPVEPGNWCGIEVRGYCGLCGAVVVDVGVHSAWHQAIRDAVTGVHAGVLDHELLKEL